LAEHGLGEFQGKSAFADARRPGKQEAAGQPSARQRSAELLDNVIMSVNAVPHGERRMKDEG
jgi:hypothetical protein